MSSNATDGAKPPAVPADLPAEAGKASAAEPDAAPGEAGTTGEAGGGEAAGSEAATTIVLDPEPSPGPVGSEDADDAEPSDADDADEPASILAYVALVTSMFALVPVALGCAIAALVGMRRSSRHGHGAAMAALFISAAWVIVGGAVGTVGVLTHGFHKPVTIKYREATVFKLQVGDCINIPNGQLVSVLPCSTPHEAEVFATFSLPSSAWPGTAVVRQEASSGCVSRLTGYLNPQLAISLAQDYVFPDQVAWTAGTRTVICEVRATSGELTGSVRGAT